jgi:uncharacterized radical SAM superfamily Fe-S cluster-containing enzyme
MADLPTRTESLCPHCLLRIEARRVTEGDSVFLEKACPSHGILEKVLLWRNTPYTYSEWGRAKTAAPRIAPGCPSQCGLCDHHAQETCTAIIEVTHRCNLQCPFCFAAAGTDARLDPDKTKIARMLETVLDRSGPCPVQFSGGEPSMRDDLPEIIRMARTLGFEHIQVNSNGVRLAREATYAAALKDAGTSVIFLQFDGLDDEIHYRIRGAALSATKREAVARCEEARLGVILVPTLVRGVNEGQIGAIIQFAKEKTPTVKGVHFQPVAFLGRYPAKPRNESRILIPEILARIEEQTGGELKAEQFTPPGCEESHCSFSAFSFVGTDGRLVPTTRFLLSRQEEACCDSDPARESRKSISSRWRFRESDFPIVRSKEEAGLAAEPVSPGRGFLDRARSQSLCISGMAFQDAWNVDLERLQKCCVHVVSQDLKIIPFCAYYMTGSSGQHLYPLRTGSA